jgi:hypothetical protein
MRRHSTVQVIREGVRRRSARDTPGCNNHRGAMTTTQTTHWVHSNTTAKGRATATCHRRTTTWVDAGQRSDTSSRVRTRRTAAHGHTNPPEDVGQRGRRRGRGTSSAGRSVIRRAVAARVHLYSALATTLAEVLARRRALALAVHPRRLRREGLTARRTRQQPRSETGSTPQRRCRRGTPHSRTYTRWRRGDAVRRRRVLEQRHGERHSDAGNARSVVVPVRAVRVLRHVVGHLFRHTRLRQTRTSTRCRVC